MNKRAKCGDDMGNLADEIERFILRKLAGQQEDIVILRRSELADELECAPSQISYVLNTRFSTARGFIVESRRGLGGFIRIARIPVQTIIFEDAAQQIDVSVTLEELGSMLVHFRDNGLLTNRESALLMETFALLFRYAKPEGRVQAIQQLLLKVSRMDE